MTKKDQVIGEVAITFEGKKEAFPIVCHRGYGVTCREVGTTNGSIAMVARGLVDRGATSPQKSQLEAQHGYVCEVTIDGKPWDCDSGVELLHAELLRLWKDFEEMKGAAQ